MQFLFGFTLNKYLIAAYLICVEFLCQYNMFWEFIKIHRNLRDNYQYGPQSRLKLIGHCYTNIFTKDSFLVLGKKLGASLILDLGLLFNSSNFKS
jgi:hypothetical protein